MEPGRWTEVDRLLQSVLQIPSAQRSAFLHSTCNGDDALRREVESLLAAHLDAGAFLERSAMDMEAEATASSSQFEIDEEVGPYRIVSKLANGGMGEVYRARDSRLERDVAIKVLAGGIANDSDGIRRVIEEARAASALNHPNVLTIFEAGHHRRTPFIVTELVEGRTLRSAISTTPLPLMTVLDIAMQIAAGLAAAHAAGIVHRDVKPENVIIRSDGLVKIVDFGLSHREADTSDRSDRGRKAFGGTVRYMSPEQVRGDFVNARSDIFSFGVMLYEMCSGVRPFAGASRREILTDILDNDPPPLRAVAPDIPPELDRIVGKALAKKREQRYPSAEEVHNALKHLRQTLEVRSHSPLSARTVVGLLLALLVATAVTFAPRTPARESPTQIAKLVPVTSNGNAVAAAISRNGRYVAYASKDGTGQSVWLKELATSTETQVVPPTQTRYDDLTFSRDGQSLYYVASDLNIAGSQSGLYKRALALGGDPPSELIASAGGFSLSPDGSGFALVRREGRTRAEQILSIVKAAGGYERTLIRRRLPDMFALDSTIAWSPNGALIAYAAARVGSGRSTLTTVSAEDSTGQAISVHGFDRIGAIAWLPDGRGLVISALDQHDGPVWQLWRVSYPDGKRQRLTHDLNDYRGVSLTADASGLVTLQESVISSLSVASHDAPTRATQILSRTGNDDGQFGIAWTPDGRIVYTSTIKSTRDLWVMDADGANRRPLTARAGRNVTPVVTDDGRYVVFGSDRSGEDAIWRMNLDGSNPVQLATAGRRPRPSPDGRWVVYMRVGPGPGGIWKVPLEGGTSVQLSDALSYNPTFSPDSTRVAYFVRGPAPHIAIISADGGASVRTFDVPSIGMLQSGPRWTPDGRALVYQRAVDGVSNLWSQPVDGSPPYQLTHFNSDGISTFDWSREGRLVFSRGTATRNVVLIGGIR